MVKTINVVRLTNYDFLTSKNSIIKILLIKKNHFFFRGKVNRQDVYQAPYVWVQFLEPKPNVLIHVICRVFADNINFDRKTARGLTRFQLFIKKDPKP